MTTTKREWTPEERDEYYRRKDEEHLREIEMERVRAAIGRNETPAEHDRARFHVERRKIIGGSDAPAVCGVSPYRGPVDVWAQKVGLVQPDEREEEYLILGETLEPYVRAKYARETGAVVERGGFILHDRIPWMGCHTDAFIGHPTKGRGVLQIKTTGFEDEEWQGGAPVHVNVQLQHEMEVVGVAWGVVAVFFGAPVLHTKFFEYESDRDFVGELIEVEAAFWKHVENKTQPTASALDARILKRLFPGVTAAEIELPPEAAEWHLNYLKGGELAKQGQQLKDGAKARLAQALGDAGRGKLPNGLGFWRRAVVHKKEHVVPATSYVDMRAVKR